MLQVDAQKSQQGAGGARLTPPRGVSAEKRLELLAAQRDDPRSIIALRDLGADLNATDDNGATTTHTRRNDAT